MSRLKYYRELRDHLKNNVEGVRYVGRFNNQFEKASEHQAFDYPCVFIQFTPGQHLPVGGGLGIQKYNLGVTLHLGFSDFSGDGENIEEFIEKVHVAAHTFVPSDELPGVGKLMRIDERESFDYDQVITHEIDFACEFMDYSADKRYQGRKQVTENIQVTID